MLKLLWLALSAVIVAGCMSASNAPTPTHRWASTSDADRAQYNNDHARCQAQARVSGSRQELETDSETFAVYKQCMNNRGYVLTAYND